MTVWFVPRDSAARSVGADEVADALVEHGHTVVRTSSRGLLWLEPLVERVADAGARIGWGTWRLYPGPRPRPAEVQPTASLRQA